jgi:asparagine synthase (glutamine-hydrolysing)
VARALERLGSGDELFLGSIAFDDHLKGELMAPGFGANGGARSRSVARELMAPLRRSWPGADAGAQVACFDSKLRLAELLLVRVDKVTMSVGLEAREPFLDHRLLDYAMRIPVGVKLRGREAKAALKAAVADLLPREIVRRPKQPFAAPIGAWLRNGLAPYVEDLVLRSSLREQGLFRYETISRLFSLHQLGAMDAGVQLWSLMNLSAWYDAWIGRRQPAVIC